MNYKSYCLFLLSGLFMLSCRKDNTPTNNTTPTPQPMPCIEITGYTAKDASNNYIGVVDSTDWRVDNYWSDCEQDLFGGSNFNTNCSFNDTLLFNPSGYPNPTHDIVHIDIGVQIISTDSNYIHAINHHDSTITMDLLFLNEDLQQVGFVHTNKYAVRTMSFSLDQMDGHPYNSKFRIYYKLTDAFGCVRMGHGDIIRQ